MPYITEGSTGFALLPKNVVIGLTLCVVIAAGAAWLDAVEVGNERLDLGSTFHGDPCRHQFNLDNEPSSVPGPPRTKKPKDTPECRGKAIFFDETLKGLGANGRACSTCHVAQDGFQLTPAHASARLQALQQARLTDPTADDPLFRPIDADDFRVNGDTASDYTTLTQDGLVRVTLPLPGNVRLVSPVGNPATAPLTDETTVDVWRSVPSILDVRITGPDDVLPEWTVPSPNRRGGYQLDARRDTLQEQAGGAFIDHAQVVLLPPQRMLDDLAAFQNSMFSSRRVERLAKAMAAGTTPLPDADPRLNRLEQQGKAVFERSCAHCHGNPEHPSTSTPLPESIPGIAFARYHDIRTACPRPLPPPPGLPDEPWLPCSPNVVNKIRTYEVTLPNGTTTRRSSSDPGRLLLVGDILDFQKFDVPNLRGISNTAPYFINNSAKTLEEVLQQYRAFFAAFTRVAAPATPGFSVISTDGIHRDRPFIPAEEPALLAYLRKQ
jgi:cytochrome c peroxidase